MSLNDPQIRKALIPKLAEENADKPDTLIIEEFDLGPCKYRIDVAVINRIIHGYEIKSARDNLIRLPKQVEIYNHFFDKVTIVTCEKHLKKIEKTVSDWWGISKATMCSNGGVLISQHRKPKNNKLVDPMAIIQLVWRNEVIWRDEALTALKELGMRKDISPEPSVLIWVHLASKKTLKRLKSMVRESIKLRHL